MNPKQILSELQTDLQRGRFVFYLEGRTDPAMLFALLGVAAPVSGIYQDVYVRGLDKASGGSAVRVRVDVAHDQGLALKASAGGIGGIVDGDGRELARLAAERGVRLAALGPTLLVEGVLPREPARSGCVAWVLGCRTKLGAGPVGLCTLCRAQSRAPRAP
jgi:hypothetical protein